LSRLCGFIRDTPLRAYDTAHSRLPRFGGTAAKTQNCPISLHEEGSFAFPSFAWAQSPDYEGRCQSIGSAPIFSSSSFARLNGREPKNPRDADSGEG
jgi:hypothetical protein